MKPMAPAPAQPSRTSAAGSPTGPAGAAAARPGLRERKKIKTRRAIRKAAYRLFGEQGYAATSIERIADEAEVSPSTVFRYFPTKEDIVLTDEYGPLVHDALLTRPADEPPVTALRRALLEVAEQSLHREPGPGPAELRQRMRLVQDVPALRARMTEQMSATVEMLASALAGRTGMDERSLELRVCTGALVGALAEALFFWAESDEPREDLAGLLDRSLRVVERGTLQTLGTE